MPEPSVLYEQILGEWSVTTFVTGGTWKENCYLVRHLPTGELALIDPGADDGQIAARVQQAGGGLRYMLLTHAHHDHVGAVAALARQFGVPCRLHRNDVRLLHHAPMYAWRFAQKRIELPTPYDAFEDGAVLQLGGQPIEVFHTPGHTAGSVCYAVGGTVFTGDTLLYQHVGRVDLPGSDMRLIRPSISQLIQRLPPETIILPGHGRPWSLREAQVWWATAADALPQYTEPSAQQLPPSAGYHE
jgi:glyoxylase-like metal-dependent hydrolase (beta-lactamase superfamily II)